MPKADRVPPPAAKDRMLSNGFSRKSGRFTMQPAIRRGDLDMLIHGFHLPSTSSKVMQVQPFGGAALALIPTFLQS